MRLRTTLLALLVFIGIVLAGTVYAGFALHKGDIVDQERRDLAVTAEAVAENLGTRIEAKQRSVTLAAGDSAAGRHGSNAQSAMVDRFLAETEFDGASIVASNGTMVAVSASNLSEDRRRALLGADFGNRSYVQRALAGETHVGEPFRAQTGNVVVTISGPIRESDGVIAGAFTGSMHVGRTSLFTRLSEMHGPQEAIEVTDGGRTLHRTGTEDNGTMGVTETIEETDWTLQVTQASGAVEERLWAATTAQAGAVVLAVLSIALVGLWIYRTTVTHLDELIDGLTRLESGEYDQELDLGVTDEWTRISSQFNALADTLAQRESQLSVLNRVLRHNLRNDMSVIIANAETVLHSSNDQDDTEHVQTIRDTAYNLVETGDHARTIYQELLGGADVDRSPVDVAAIAERQADHIQRDFPEATIETELPVAAWVMDGDAIPIVIDELCRNALVHNDAATDERRVWLTVEHDPEDESVAVHVRDNGPGLPDVEAKLVTGAREETSIEHGSGLGLWVVNWLVDQLDGRITVDRDDRGTTVTVVLPAAERPTEHTADRVD